jgi:hypothetical protein
MKLRPRLAVAALAALALPLYAFARAQDPTNPADPRNYDMAAMMKKWKEVCTPNANHQKLARFVGKWETESGMSMELGAEPVKTKGSAEIEWLYEGRWLIERSEGSMMGMPMKTVTISGYDNFKKKYVSTVVNSTTTGLLHAEGNFDASGKNLITYGLMDEPMTGEHDKTVRYVTRFLDADTFVFEVHDLAIGEKDNKVIEVTYKRKK